MGTYYNDVKEITGFTEESLKREICSVFDCGIAAATLFGKSTELTKAKNECLVEVFAHMVAFSFPDLDELKSDGALQKYVELLRKERK